MGLKSRPDLKALFENGKKLSQQAFSELIDSTLNKRDDCFMGKWRPGTTYRIGDVVVYDRALWQLTPKDDSVVEICSHEPPSETNLDWSPLIVPVEDNDWVVKEDIGVMYAKVFKCVGIGKLFEDEPPGAKLEILDEGLSRYLIFPKTASTPTLSLFQIGDGEERQKTYFITGLDNEEVNFLTDVRGGFLFRSGEVCEDDEDANEIRPTDGDVMLVLKPGPDGETLAGINTPDPKAMLDITDGTKGQFLFDPHTKEDPVFSILNLAPDCATNYLATGVGADNAIFNTDSPKGFLFRHGREYVEQCSIPDINEGSELVIIRWNEEGRPRVGIGTTEPCEMLDVTDGVKGAFLVNPERFADPVFSLVKLDPANAKNYLAGTIGAERASFATDAPKGFEFKTGNEIESDCPSPDLGEGKRLVVMLPDGKVGIGTETYDPTVRVEVTDEKSGKFLFNLDDKKVNPALGILNTRPGSEVNYFTLGADNQTAVLATDSKNGFAFKQGGPAGTNDNEVDVVQGDIILRLMPFKPRGVVPAEAIFFPDIKGKIGVQRKPGDYQLDLKGVMRTYNVFHDTDHTNMSNEQKLGDYFEEQGYGTALSKVMELVPHVFDWDGLATGLYDEGKQFGLKAQEVQDVLPELVKENSTDNKLAVTYPNLIAVLVKAIQEQQAVIADLKQRVEALES